MKRGVSRFVWCEVCRGVGSVSGLSGWPAFRGVSMEVWSQWKPGLLSVFLPPGDESDGISSIAATYDSISDRLCQ